MPIEIRIFPPMPTRPCRYCLSLQGDSVFADFDINDSSNVYLRRISFDGYGCCRVDEVRPMSDEDSHSFVRWIESDDVENDGIRETLSKYFNENKDVIWPDALADHELL